MNKEAKDTTEASLTLGEALKQHRQAKKMSVHDVAVALNLKETVITDIEDNLETVIADNVYQSLYLRGYIVNYAKVAGLVNLKSYPEYQQFSQSQKHTKKVPPQHIVIPPKKKNKSLTAILLFIFLMMVAAAVYFFIPLLSHQPSEAIADIDNTEMRISTTNDLNVSDALETDNTSQLAPSEEPIERVETIDSSEADSTDQDLLSTEQAAVNGVPSENIDEAQGKIENSTPENIQEDTAQQVTTEQTLSLTFKAECWTEIVDANGKRLAYNLYKSGDELTLAGVPPFNLKLGNPLAVDIIYQDKLVEKTFKEGALARFSLPE